MSKLPKTVQTMAYIFAGGMALVAIRYILHVTGAWPFAGL